MRSHARRVRVSSKSDRGHHSPTSFDSEHFDLSTLGRCDQAGSGSEEARNATGTTDGGNREVPPSLLDQQAMESLTSRRYSVVLRAVSRREQHDPGEAWPFCCRSSGLLDRGVSREGSKSRLSVGGVSYLEKTDDVNRMARLCSLMYSELWKTYWNAA
jgi:hypothetical protein